MPVATVSPGTKDAPLEIGMSPSFSRPWVVLLAGGKGRRLAPLVRRIHGDGRPKQFAAIIGTRSMLEHTYARALRCTCRERVLIVTVRGQERWAFEQLPDAPRENFLVQPKGMGSGPAVALAVARILSEGRNSSVVFFPTDHFVYPEEKFCGEVDRLLSAVDGADECNAVLLGTRAAAPRGGMDWIMPCSRRRDIGGERVSCMPVRQFIEMPQAELAERLFEGGGYSSTLIFGGKARRLWRMLMRRTPRRDAWIGCTFCRQNPSMENMFLETLYGQITRFSISRDIFAGQPDELGVLPLEGVAWDDWGTVAGIQQSLERMEWQGRLRSGQWGGLLSIELERDARNLAQMLAFRSHGIVSTGGRRGQGTVLTVRDLDAILSAYRARATGRSAGAEMGARRS